MTIEQALSALIGTPLWDAWRSVDLASFQFGSRRTATDRRGCPIQVGDHALHLQCPWRIVSDRGIFVASIDIYRPQFGAGATENQAFDWDRQPNRFEQLIARFFDNGQRAYVVEGISVDIAAAFTLKMRGGYFLEVFPNNSALDIEYWRLFEPRKDKPHFVVEGGGASD